MIKVNKEINLAQLDKELNGQGLIAELNQDTGEVISVGFADNNSATQAQLKNAIDAHIAIDEVEAKAAAKAALLDRLGISAEEARLLLS
jgi:hypothetical protein